uniref:TldD/PmbA family protein n=1 Tax=Thermofilum pendens TaxID=2269 RepID=A0A7J3X9A7_THEPE
MEAEVLSLLDWALKRARELGADEAEVSVTLSRTRQVKSEGVHLKALSRRSVDAWVRVSRGKRFAITTVTSLEQKPLEEAVEAAVALASKAEEDPYWEGLPDPEPPLHGWVGYDQGVTSAPTSWLLKLARELIAEAQRHPSIRVSGTFVSASETAYYVANSRGVSASDKGTHFGYGIELKAVGAGEGIGFSSMSSRGLHVDIYGVLERATTLALDSMKGEKLGTVIKGNVLFRAEPFASLVDALLVPALSALSVLEGFSPLRDKIGQKVLGPLTVVDDGTMVGGLETSLFDAEGVARRRKVLFDKGVLKGYLHNTYTARRMKCESTGNAARVRGAVLIARTNLVVEGGEDSEEALASDSAVVVDGYLLSVHTVNYITGNFSVVASNPYLVKNGELKPLKPVTVSGNIYEVAGGLRPAKRVKNTYTGIYTPDVLFSGLTVSG